MIKSNTNTAGIRTQFGNNSEKEINHDDVIVRVDDVTHPQTTWSEPEWQGSENSGNENGFVNEKFSDPGKGSSAGHLVHPEPETPDLYKNPKSVGIQNRKPMIFFTRPKSDNVINDMKADGVIPTTRIPKAFSELNLKQSRNNENSYDTIHGLDVPVPERDNAFETSDSLKKCAEYKEIGAWEGNMEVPMTYEGNKEDIISNKEHINETKRKEINKEATGTGTQFSDRSYKQHKDKLYENKTEKNSEHASYINLDEDDREDVRFKQNNHYLHTKGNGYKQYRSKSYSSNHLENKARGASKSKYKHWLDDFDKPRHNDIFKANNNKHHPSSSPRSRSTTEIVIPANYKRQFERPSWRTGTLRESSFFLYEFCLFIFRFA